MARMKQNFKECSICLRPLSEKSRKPWHKWCKRKQKKEFYPEGSRGVFGFPREKVFIDFSKIVDPKKKLGK